MIHFDLYSTLGNHQGFMLLFTAAVLALPPSEYRQIALQAAAAHQLGSSGLQKLKIGGLRWPKSLALSLQYRVSNGPTIASDAYLEPDFVKLKSVVQVGRPCTSCCPTDSARDHGSCCAAGRSFKHSSSFCFRVRRCQECLECTP